MKQIKIIKDDGERGIGYYVDLHTEENDYNLFFSSNKWIAVVIGKVLSVVKGCVVKCMVQ